MTLRARAKAFHGGYWVETSYPTRTSLFIFVYTLGYGGTLYVVRRGLDGKPILKHFVGR